MRSFNQLKLAFGILMFMGGLPLHLSKAVLAANSGECRERILRIARFEPHFVRLQSFLDLKTGEKKSERIARILKEDARFSIFQLEFLARIYREVKEPAGSEKESKNPFSKMKDQLKEFEDAIGGLDAQISYAKYLESLDAPRYALRFSRQQIRAQQSLVKKLLSGWINIREEDSTTRIDRMRAKVTNWNEFEDRAELYMVLKAFVKTIKEIEDLNFDTEKLQKGIHEMRRQLRWILIGFQALQGLIQLKDSTEGLPEGLVKHYSYLLTSPLASSRFNQIPENPMVKEPLYIPRIGLLAISKAVEELGEYKTFGENISAAEDAWASKSDGSVDILEAQRRVQLRARKKGILYYNPHEYSESVRRELLTTGILKYIREDLERQILKFKPQDSSEKEP